MLNGRLSMDPWAATDLDSLDSSRSARNYNFLVQTYLDYLTFPRGGPSLDSQHRPLKQALLYISLLLGSRRQTEAYVNFLLTVSDTQALKIIGETTREYFDDELCITFMKALAKEGIEMVPLMEAERKTQEDEKAEGIIKWLYQ
jgi:hypothetical protein